MTLKEAAEYSGLSYCYMRQIAKSGRLRAHKIGMQWVTTKDAIHEYLRTRKKIGAYREDLDY